MSRQLGGIERYYICRNIQGFYSNFSVTGHYNKKLTKEIVSNGLQELIEKYPVFAQFPSRINDLDDVAQKYKNYVLKSVDSIDFDDVVLFKDEPFDEKSLEFLNEINFPPNQDKPTWKVVIFSNNYLSFVNDHLLFDGQSGSNFHTEFTNIISGLSQQLDFKQSLYTVKDIKIKVSPHDLSIYKYSFWEVARFLVKEKIPQYVANHYNYYYGDNYPNLNQTPLYKSNHKKQSKTFFNIINVSPIELDSLMKILKPKGVSLTAFLVVYINYCFQKTIVTELSPAPLPIKCCIPVSGRNFYSNESSEFKEDLKFKFAVSAAHVTTEPVSELGERAFELMMSAKRTIHNQASSEETFNLVGFAELANPYDTLNVNQPSTTDTFFEISNIGNNVIEQGEWKIDDLIFSQCIGAGNIFGFSAASTPENGLNLAFTHLEEYKHVSIQGFIDFFKRELEAFISN